MCYPPSAGNEMYGRKFLSLLRAPKIPESIQGKENLQKEMIDKDSEKSQNYIFLSGIDKRLAYY